MSVYRMKAMAFKKVRDLNESGISKEVIVYNIMLNFGLSEKFVEKCLDTIHNVEGKKGKEEFKEPEPKKNKGKK